MRITVGIGLLAAGCVRDVPSDEVTTGDVVLDAWFVDDGAAVDLDVGLKEGNRWVELVGGDRLVAHDGANEVGLAAIGSGKRHRYGASLPANNGLLPIDLTFSHGGVDARSDIIMPVPFALTEVTDPVDPYAETWIRWEPTGNADEVRVLVEGPCIETYEWVGGDSGGHGLGLDVLDYTDETGCSGTVVVERSRWGTIAAELKRGVFVGTQVRSRDVTLLGR